MKKRRLLSFAVMFCVYAVAACTSSPVEKTDAVVTNTPNQEKEQEPLVVESVIEDQETPEKDQDPTQSELQLLPKKQNTVQPDEVAISIEQKETEIMIDGEGSDWQDYEVLMSDKLDDNQEGGFDISALRAFYNNRYLYLLLEAQKPPSDYVQTDLIITIGSRTYIVSFPPGGNGFMGDITGGQFTEIGEVVGGISAVNSALEYKMPLSAFDEVSDIKLAARVMAGECCDPPAWYAVDEIGQIKIPQLDEIEPEQDLTMPPHSPGAALVIDQTEIDFSNIAGDEPTDLVMAADGERIYTVGRNTDNVFVIDVASNQIIKVIDIVPVNENAPYGSRPERLALTQNDALLLVGNFNDGSVTLMDTESLQVIDTIPLLSQIVDIAAAIDGDVVYAVSRNQPTIAQFYPSDLETVSMINIPVPAFAIAVSSDGKQAYAATSRGVIGIDTESKQITRQIALPVQGYMGNILLTGDNSTAYVSMRNTDQVLEVDLESGKVIRTFEVLGAAEGLALNSSESLLFVGTFGAFMNLPYTVGVIDLESGEVVGGIMPSSPADHVSWVPDVEGIALTPDDNQVYFATVDADGVFIADVETMKHTGTIPLTEYARLQPERLTISPDGNWLFTVNAAPQVPSISQISVGDHEVSTFYYNEPESGCLGKATGLDVSFDGEVVYVAVGNCLLSFDIEEAVFEEKQIFSLPDGQGFSDLKMNPDGKHVLLLDTGGGVTVFDLTSEVSERLQVLPDGYHFKFGLEGRYLYITGSSDYAVVDVSNMEIVRTSKASWIEDTQFSSYSDRLIGIDPQGEFYLIGDFDRMAVIDGNSHQQMRMISLEEWSAHRQLATDVVFVPDGSKGYLSMWDMKGIAVFDPETWQLVAQIGTGQAPYHVVCPDDLVISPDGKTLYVTGEQSDNILIVDTSTDQAKGVIELIP